MKKKQHFSLSDPAYFHYRNRMQQQKDAIRFGAADIGGIYYTFANAYAGLFNNDAPDYSIEVKKTAGSAANLRLLADGYIDLCIAQNDMIDDAVNGTGTFVGKSISGYSAIASLYPEACQIIVKKIQTSSLSMT